MPLARELSGVIVMLPEEDSILSDPHFREKIFHIGGTVVAVSLHQPHVLAELIHPALHIIGLHR